MLIAWLDVQLYILTDSPLNPYDKSMYRLGTDIATSAFTQEIQDACLYNIKVEVGVLSIQRMNMGDYDSLPND